MYCILKLQKIYEHIIEHLCVIILGFTFLANIAQVFRRYVLGSSFIWTEELSRIALIWIVALGISITYKEHLSMDYFFLKMPSWLQKILISLKNFLIILFNFIMFYYGIGLVKKASIRLPGSHLHLRWAYLSIPVGFALFTFILFLQIFLNKHQKKKEENIE